MRYYLLLLISMFMFSQNRINGLSFVASNNIPVKEEVQYVKDAHANWVTLMPFAFMKSEHDTLLIYNSQRQWIGERVEGVEKTVLLFRNQNVKVMIKPQIWIPRGGFTGNINFQNENEWQVFEKQYEKFIMTYVNVAVKTKAEMFCIGTELKFFAQKRVVFFKKLISNIRKVYIGKITYAENWDCYDKVTFWNLLDYIGIDAYFELEGSKTPQLKTLIKSWKPIKEKIKQLSEKFDKKILFTEYGYQSKDYTAQKPYAHSDRSSVNLEGQNQSIEALYKTFWQENWFAGGFNWKWYDDYKNSGGIQNTDYTIQNKPAEKILKKYYKN